MSLTELSSLHTQVLWAAFAVSIAFGAVAQKTHFCTMGAISDIVNMGDWTRMRMWGMAVGTAILGFYGMAALGLIDPSKTFYTNPRLIWLSALVGGAFFGFGMVLASGCGSKTLVRIGGGSLKGLVVFFVMGVSAFATLKGLTAVLRVKTVDAVAIDIPGGTGLPNLLSQASGLPASTAAPLLAVLLGGGLVLWALASRNFRTPNHLLAGLGIGGSVVGMWWVTGHLGFVAEHPETLDSTYLATNSGLMESLTFTAPMAYAIDWLVHFSDTTKVLTVGVVSVGGVVLGSWVCALATRSFRWEGFRDTQDTALHIGGAVLMGMGGVTAMGCTVGQGLSGLSTLSLTSIVAVVGIVLGALGGLRFQLWLVMRD
ncbi:MAG: transporter [Polaromonas sp.]|nr:transporter [Polaromonas sp.]